MGRNAGLVKGIRNRRKGNAAAVRLDDADNNNSIPEKVANGCSSTASKSESSLMVSSVEKAFRVLSAFDDAHPTLSLTQLASVVDLDKSAIQRFTYTLMRLGLLAKDPITKRFELTSRTLEFGYRFSKSNPLVRRAAPYLLHLSQETEETVNLTVLDDTNIVFISRFQSRHVLNADVVIGTSLPAFCTAPGIAILSRLPESEVSDILDRSDLRPITPRTTWNKADLLAKVEQARATGYAVAWNEYYLGDLSVAAAINGPRDRPLGAISIAVSAARYRPEEAESKFAGLALATASALG